MTAHKLTSPCPSCSRWGEEMDECATYCQPRRDYLHIAFGEPQIDTAILRQKHEKERLKFSPARQLDFSGPGPKSRKFNCPICYGEVETSLHSQRTCGQAECRKKYERLADAARKAKNREQNNARERQRKRGKRLSGAVI